MAYQSGAGAFVFTWLVTLAICFPELRGRHRGMQAIREHAPTWYQLAAVAHFILFALMLLSLLMIVAFTALH